MVAKKCDICGKFYEAYNCAKNTESCANSIMFCNNRLDGNTYGKNIPRDLCPECMCALRAFLRERGWVDG